MLISAPSAVPYRHHQNKLVQVLHVLGTEHFNVIRALLLTIVCGPCFFQVAQHGLLQGIARKPAQHRDMLLRMGMSALEAMAPTGDRRPGWCFWPVPFRPLSHRTALV